jgi:enoyl-CoA hydratase/carnithine racemase
MPVRVEKQGSVARIVMDNGKNLHNPQFVEAMLAALDRAEADAEVSAVVIVSTDDKNWSQGIDLQWILGCWPEPERHAEVRGFLYRLDDLFARLLTFPVPVIASINGHAFGDGAIMACACDFRFMRADKGFFCFPEVDVSIPFLPGMLAICMKAVPEQKLNEMYLMGKRCEATELAAAHVVEAAPADAAELEGAVMAFAGSFAKGRRVFGEIKRRRYQYLLDILKNDDPAVIEPLALMWQ